MKKILALGLAIGLSGCVTARQASDYLCHHQTEVRRVASAALIEAEKIKDSVKREAAISAVNITLAALDKCPVNTPGN